MKLRVKTDDGFELSTICRQLKFKGIYYPKVKCVDSNSTRIMNRRRIGNEYSSISNNVLKAEVRNWLTTAEAVEEYHMKRKRKR
jgi:hypothetical protein